ncbi:MAG: DUF192 domain-containing protein [Caulobacterales bacterium]|nr:DUF192 domain-containing protein [Caulobacterales bacterium]
MRTPAVWTAFALVLAACSDSASKTPAPPPAPSEAPPASSTPAPASAAVTPAAAPAACATLRNPHSGALEPLEAVTGSGVVKFQVEIADTDAERQYGFMCRPNVAPDRGMLFEFEASRPQAFWMHNTLVPLDIIYIGQDGKVVSIGRNARPLDDSAVPSGGPAIGVLELAGGRAAEIGLLPGDQIRHPFFKP